MANTTVPNTKTSKSDVRDVPGSPTRGGEVELNLRPGVHLSPPRPPGLGIQQHHSPQAQGMDDLSDAFAGAFTVTNTPNDTNRPHPRFSQYKVKGGETKAGQEMRRQRLLSHQKSRRDDLVSHARCLAMGEFTEDGMDDEDEEEGEDMDTSEVRVRRLKKTYKNQLMLSEWLVEVPQDLVENWLMLLCPEGRRNFVVASNGQTKVYSKSGKQVKSFPSNLPGGNRSQGGRRKGSTYTILDCIFSDTHGIFYILDMMCWDGYQYYDCDTEFRLSWVQQKFIEHQELSVRSRINPYSFQPLPVYQCTRESISDALNASMPFNDNLDGILIYHRHVHYMPGKTPLVGWLKGYMVPELLEIAVCEDLMEQRPHDYGGMKTYLKKTYDRVERLKKEDEERLRKENDTMYVENGDHI